MSKIFVSAKQGKRSTMEDRHIVNPDLMGDGLIQFFAVFDGHGGDGVAEFLVQNFENVLKEIIVNEKTLSGGNIDYKGVLTSCFDVCDDAVNKDYERRFAEQEGWDLCLDSGSTAAVVLIVNNLEIFCANVGDTEVIFGPLAKPFAVITTVHKPSFVEEHKRVTEAGGYVSNYFNTARVNGSLAVSRAFGNCRLTSNDRKVINAVPSVWCGSVAQGDVVILACDGLWDVYTYNDVLNDSIKFLAQNGNEGKNCAEFLVDQAIEERFSKDNVTVIVIQIMGK